MDINQWAKVFKEAYHYFNISFDSDKNNFLASACPDRFTSTQNEIYSEARDAIFSMFFKRAVKGKYYGRIEETERRLGIPFIVFYGPNEGPFVKFAKTYWTFKTELKKEVFLSEEGVLQIMEDTLNTGVNFIKSLFSS